MDLMAESCSVWSLLEVDDVEEDDMVVVNKFQSLISVIVLSCCCYAGIGTTSKTHLRAIPYDATQTTFERAVSLTHTSVPTNRWGYVPVAAGRI